MTPSHPRPLYVTSYSIFSVGGCGDVIDGGEGRYGNGDDGQA